MGCGPRVMILANNYASEMPLGERYKEWSMDYAEIKIMAQEQKVRVTDLIVLAPANDPFYVGTDGDTLLGNWFYELWQRFNYTQRHK